MSQVAHFIAKLHTILEENSYNHIICWSTDSVHIKDPKLLVEEVLPKFFRQQRLESFVRQLNLYGFRKVHRSDKAIMLYGHELFREGQSHLLQSIQLKAKASRAVKREEVDPAAEQQATQQIQGSLETHRIYFIQTMTVLHSYLKAVMSDNPVLDSQLKDALRLAELNSLIKQFPTIKIQAPQEVKQEEIRHFETRSNI